MYEHLKHRVLYLEGDMPFCVNLNVGTCMESCYGFLFMCIMSSTFFFIHLTKSCNAKRNAMSDRIVHRRSSLDLCRLWRVGPMSGSGGVAKERQRKAKWKS